jgi:acyl transferase domain-containing protein
MSDRGNSRAEPIAVIGMACRLPGASTLDEFWRLLAEGGDAIGVVPADRWDGEALYDAVRRKAGRISTKRGGFIRDLDAFDAGFFGIDGQDARRMDPQQKLALEVVWEALEDAGVVAAQWAGREVGVYMGVTHSDHGRSLLADIASMDGLEGTNSYGGFVAHRVSYLLNLQGPSMAVDSACSSSLVAVHLASQALRMRDCDLAIVGGVTVHLLPGNTMSASTGGMLSPDGHCKSFDQSGDGFGRGEGCGVVVLKRFSDAEAAGDNIWAVIRGSAVNHNGLSNGITAPSGLAQQAVIRRALAVAEVAPTAIGYVEAHGSGTVHGDAIEMRALQKALGPGRHAAEPCRVGSVKTNVGHLEAASGVAGLIKVALMLRHRQIPPLVHLRRPNQYIALADGLFSLPTALEPWAAPASGRRLAGVSAFGFGGTNCHLVVEEAPAAPDHENDRERPLHVLVLRARSRAALEAMARRFSELVVENPHCSFADLCHGANVGRTDFEHRLAIAAASLEEARRSLDDIAAGRAEHAITGKADGHTQPKLAFLFDGSAGDRRAAALFYETSPMFRRAFDALAAVFAEHLDGPLTDTLRRVEQDDVSRDGEFLAFAGRHALAELWLSWGVAPTRVLARGSGTLVAACFAKALDLAAAGRLLAERKRRRSAGEDGDLTIPQRLFGSSDKPRWPLFGVGQGPAATAAGHVILMFGDDAPATDALGAGLGDGAAAWRTSLRSLCRLFVAGVAVDWKGFDAGYRRRRIALPSYPFERASCRFEPETVPPDQAASRSLSRRRGFGEEDKAAIARIE